MAQSVTVIDQATHAATPVTGQEASLSAQSIVELLMSRAQVKSFARQGSDLMITTADGQMVVVHEFFVKGQAKPIMFHNDGGLWPSDLSSLDTLPDDGNPYPAVVADNTFTPVESTAAASLDTPAAAVDNDVAAANALPWVPLALAAVGFAAAASGGGSGGSSSLGVVSAPSSGTPVQNSGSLSPALGQTQSGNSAAATTSPDSNASTNSHDSTAAPDAQTSFLSSGASVDTGASGGQPATQTSTNDTTVLVPMLDPVTTHADGSITVSGTAEAGSTVSVIFPDGATVMVVVGADGHFTFTSATAESDGTISATTTDTAGQTSAAADMVYTGAAQQTADATSDQNSAASNPHSDNTGGAIDTSSVPDNVVTNPDGSTTQTTVPGTGDSTAFDASDTTGKTDATAGTTPSQAGVVDSAGNTVGDATTQMAVVDTTAPTEAITIDASVYPNVGGGASYVLTGTLNAALANGNASGASAELLQVSLDGGQTWNPIDVSGTSWAYGLTSLPANNFTVEARVVDVAGNAGPTVTQQVTVHDDSAIAPITIGTDTWVSDGNHSSASDFITSTTLNGGDGTLTVSGNLDQALQAGGSVQVSLDGVTWTEALVTGANWDASFGVTDGTYTLEAREVNAAGVATALAMQSIVVGNTAPTETAMLDIVPGAVDSQYAAEINYEVINSNNSTNQPEILTPTFSGTLSSNLLSADLQNGGGAEQLQIGFKLVDSDGSDGRAITSDWVWLNVTDIDPDGQGGCTWSYTVPDPLQPYSTYNVELRVVDEAGNITASEPVSTLATHVTTDGDGTLSSSEALPQPDLLYTVLAIGMDEAGGSLGSQTAQRGEVGASGALNLSLQEVLSDAGKLAGAGASGPVTVGGGAVSMVHLAEGVGTGANQWQNTGATIVDGVIYDVYHNIAQGGNTVADLLIQHGIAVI